MRGYKLAMSAQIFDPTMACSNPKKKPRLGTRQSLQLTHASEEAKRAFNDRLDNLRRALTPGSNDNLPLITKLLEIAENQLSTSQTAHNATNLSTTFLTSAGKYEILSSWHEGPWKSEIAIGCEIFITVLSVMMIVYDLHVVAGVYTSDSTEGDQSLFIVERQAWYDLCSGLSQRCSCSLATSTWTLDQDSIMQVSQHFQYMLSSLSLTLFTSMGMY